MTLTHTLVVATKDRPADVAGLLQCLHEVTPLPDEIIVLDASTTEATRAVCDAGRGALPLRHVPARRAGLASQRNQALELVTTDLVHFLDDDSRPTPGYFGAVVDFFERDTAGRVGGVTGLVTNPGPARKNTLIHRLFLLNAEQGRLNRAGRNAIVREASTPVQVQCLSGCTMSFRTEALRVHGFDEDLQRGVTGGYALGEDLDAGLRLGRELWCVPEARLEHAESPVNRAQRLTYEHASASFRRRLAEDPATPVSRAAFLWSCAGEAALGVATQLLRRDPNGVAKAAAVLRGARDRSVVRREVD